MKKPSLIQGILVAFVFAAVSVPLLMMLFFVGVFAANKFLIVILAFSYILYIAARSKSRVGRTTLSTVSFLLLFGACFLGVPTFFVVLLAIGLIWLVRSLLNYSSIVPALIDGVLCSLSLGCAVGAWLFTGSIFAVAWCFFLPQALFVFIPRRIKRQAGGSESVAARGESGSKAKPDSFTRAHRAAEEAIRCLAQA